MSKKAKHSIREIPAIRVRQWLSSWDSITFDKALHQSKPRPDFFLFTLAAADLKALTGIYRRSTKSRRPRAKDPNVQRAHDEARSQRIRDFVRFGFPWCELNEGKRQSGEYADLRKPGWLPTAIVVNILPVGGVRDGQQLAAEDALTVTDGDESPTIRLPSTFSNSKWQSSSIPPLEVIDGQHRLWALDGFNPLGEFHMPVVAFDDLDRSWQAYLFWSINITPKRIKQSLAFDLYPLLRTEDWLERFEGHSIYRETRAQEVVEAIWAHPDSPWYQRINMLGESGLTGPMVSQAAWIRSLMATFIKSWEGRGRASGIGGLFGAPPRSHEIVLPWNRAQQAALIIFAGQALQKAVDLTESHWALHLRKISDQRLFADDDDPAFYGPHSLLSTDQGIRGFLAITNDILFVLADDLKLTKWHGTQGVSATDESAVTTELKSIRKQKFSSTISDIASALATYDWRTSSTPELSDKERKNQSIYRGSGGYKQLRADLLIHIGSRKGTIADAAKTITKALGY